MEGSYWLRLGTIIAMAFGTVYVLLPTYLHEPDVSVDGVQQVEVAQEAPLEVWFTTPDGIPDEATVTAFDARLRGAGVDVDRVTERDGKVVVFLRAGARKADVEAVAASSASVAAVYDIASLGIDPARLAELDDPAAALSAAVSGADLTAVTASAATVASTSVVDGALQVVLDDTSLTGPHVLAVDGVAVGWFDAATGVVTLVQGDAAAIAAGLAPADDVEVLSRVVPEAVADKGVKADEATPDAPEAWWASLLLDTRLNLGLDLQGGIDLTLQVDQDAAVVASVQTTRRNLADQAAKDGRDLKVQRDRTRYAVRVSGEALSSCKPWVDEQLRGEYIYAETVPEEGVDWHVFEMSEPRVAEIQDQAVEQNLETLRKRVDATGVKEPAIVKMGGGRINIQLPGVSDTRQATEAIGKQATLLFRMVDEDADQNQVARAVTEAERALPADQFDDLDLLNEWLRAEGHLSEERIVMFRYEETEPGVWQRAEALQLIEDVPLSGADIDNAGVRFDQTNTPNVTMSFKPRGSQVFCDITRANVGKRFAIILDDEIRSSPNIREAICGGSANIEMGGSANAIDDANTLALVLRTGALTAPVDIGEVRLIGASLGADAIEAGAEGALIGGALTLLFMFLWYRMPGAIADVALVLNVFMVFALLALFGATLTLPGIAGIALTIGMAVDANIIIYERIREELKLGVNARKAVDTGYEKGIVAVLDANVTTAIAGVVLYSYGTGPIKGFAVTLLIGIFTTLVTALFVTRTFMEMLTRRSNARIKL